MGCRLAPPTRMTSAFSSPSPLSCVRAHPRRLSRRSPGLRDGWNRSAALLRPGSERGARSSRADRRLDARARPPLIGFHGRARSVGPYPAGDGEPAGDDRMSVDGAHEPSGRLRPRKPITYDESRHDGSSSRSDTSSHPPQRRSPPDGARERLWRAHLQMALESVFGFAASAMAVAATQPTFSTFLTALSQAGKIQYLLGGFCRASS